MNKPRILLIEGKRAGQPTFAVGLAKKSYHVETFAAGGKALEHIKEDRPHLVLVNAASMRTSGRRICQSIRQLSPDLPIVLVVESDADVPDKSEADVVLVNPFTLQKLTNRIKSLLPKEPKDIVQVGPLQLDTEQHWVRTPGRQASLTPRLVTLLKVLMEHPGEVIDRNELFSRVWETGYTVDTRTLDVHISWLRQAMEEDPRHPRYLKTVRGVGYRLDID